jgi:uncharacterized protein YcbK (DUF882 family)
LPFLCETDMDRRAFLTALVAGPFLGPSLATAFAPVQGVHEQLAGQGVRSRFLWITRPQSGESFRGFWADENGRLLPGYYEACTVLRDVRADQVGLIDPRLLDVLSGLHWVDLMEKQPLMALIVLSGLRLPHTNARIEGAAKDSEHTRGKAVDVRHPRLTPQQLATRIQALKGLAGGLGVYVDRNFVHVDSGRFRSWGRG